MSPRIFLRIFSLRALLGILIALNSPGQVFAAEPPRPFTILRRDGPSVFLDYFPSGASGVSILHFLDELPELRSTNVRLFAVPAGLVPITFDITSFAITNRGFFAVTEFPALTPTDFELDTDDPIITEEPPAYELETLTAIPSPLTTSTPLLIHFRLLHGTTNDPLSVDGSVRLELRTASGEPVAFAYTLTPNTLQLIAGVVNGSVTLATNGSLDGVFIAVAGVTLSASARGGPALANATPQTIGSNALLGEKPKVRADYLNTVAGWHYPLSSLKALAGCFGEWRSGGTNGSGRPHFGMDLATSAGSNVYPVKRGVVSWVGSLGANGQYIVVVHGDGTASRYLHVVPSRPVHSVVETSTVIARTADIAADHLHLELRSGATPATTAGAYRIFKAFPGAGFDPGVQNTGFDISPIQNGVNDVNDPEIKALYLWKGNPKRDLFAAGAPGYMQPDLLSPVQNLVVQIVDKEGVSTTSGYLVPAHFDVAVEDPVTQVLAIRDSFNYDTEVEARKLFQDNAASFPNFGYVRRTGNILPQPSKYQYWFKWDTVALYANQQLGRRKVRITAGDRAGHSTAQTFTFGPEIIQPGTQLVDSSTPNGSTFTVTAKSYMGPFPAAQYTGSAGPRDELTFSFQGSTSSWDAFFLDPTKGNAEVPTLKWTFVGDSSGVKEDTIQVRVKKKAGAPTPSAAETISLKATSAVFPGIAHKMDVQILPDDIVAGYVYSVVATGDFRPEVSINDAGAVTFVTNLGSNALIVAMPGSAPQNVGTTRQVAGFSPMPQINNAAQVAARETVSNSSLVRIWSLSPPSPYTIASGSSDPAIAASLNQQNPEFDLNYAAVQLPTIANDGGFAYVGISGSGSVALYFNPSPNPPTGAPTTEMFRATLSGGGFRPMVGDGGRVVSHNDVDGIRSINLYGTASPALATVGSGWTALGTSPGISDDGQLAAFYGAATPGGAGIFLSIPNSAGTARRVIRVAGSPGELGQAIGFSSFEAGSRVAVARQSLGKPGLEDDFITLSFIGTPAAANSKGVFSANRGIWTVQGRLEYPNLASELEFESLRFIPVAQVGDIDVIPGSAITNLSVHDQLSIPSVDLAGQPRIAGPGDHFVAFLATTSSGTSVVRATLFGPRAQ